MSTAMSTMCVMFLSDCVVIYLMKLLKPIMSPSSYYAKDHEIHDKDSYHLGIMSAIDYNQFTFFLLANICTGLVNFTIDTIHTGPALSFIILIMYLIVLMTLTMLLKVFMIKLF